MQPYVATMKSCASHPRMRKAYYDQAYNAIARKEDCVLLPRASRRKANTWKVPRKSKGVAYGLGQSNVWFAQGREDNKLLDQFLNKIVRQIEEYDGENWIDKYAEVGKY